MRIGVCGASGVGKTTFVREVVKLPEFMHLSFIQSTARAAADAGYKINKEADRLDQLLILTSRVNAELSAGDHYISDRTPLDSLAYSYYQAEHRGWDDFYMRLCDQMVSNHMGTYDYVLYMPITFQMTADDYRVFDEDYQKQIDATIMFLLDELGVKYVQVPTGTPSERAEWLQNMLGQRRNGLTKPSKRGKMSKEVSNATL